MKKLVSILLFAVLYSFTMQAQEKRRDQRPQLSVDQQTDLLVKRMTLSLDLTDKQQIQLKPLLKKQAEQRKAAMQKRQAFKEKESKPTADEVYAMRSNQLDNQIAFKNSMKQILDKDQFVRFEKMAKARKMKGKQHLKRKMGMQKNRKNADGKNRKN